MKSQPKANFVSNDDVQTPILLAQSIVDHFKPFGDILEPCCGEGAFRAAIDVHCIYAPSSESFPFKISKQAVTSLGNVDVTGIWVMGALCQKSISTGYARTRHGHSSARSCNAPCRSPTT